MGTTNNSNKYDDISMTSSCLKAFGDWLPFSCACHVVCRKAYIGTVFTFHCTGWCEKPARVGHWLARYFTR